MSCTLLGFFLGILSVVGSASIGSAAAFTWTDGAGFRSAPVQWDAAQKTGFTMVSPQQTSVVFTNRLEGDAYATNVVAHNGSGVAIGDVDGDGWPDLYFCALQGANQLYRNLGGWHFELVEIGVAACAGQFSTGAALVDIDGDGDLDLLVNGIAAGTRLFLNDGLGHWTESMNSGLSRTASATSMAFADIDGDGDLDLYCAHYIDVLFLADPTTRLTVGTQAGHSVVETVNGQSALLAPWKDRFEVLADGNVRELGEADALYRNDGNGHFTSVQTEVGRFLDETGQPMSPPRELGLAVMFRDFNGDRAPDCYVCNDNATPDRFWVNTGEGRFRAISPLAMRHGSRSSMGVDFADVDRDGRDDLIVTDMLARSHGKRMAQRGKTAPTSAEILNIEGRPMYHRNTLFLGRKDGSFVEAALFAGVAASDWSWCPVFLDVDLDGYEDLLITNGFEQDVLDQDSLDEIGRRRWTPAQMRRYRQIHPSWRTENVAFRNQGDGSFVATHHDWGFHQEGVSYGMALGDLDNDGDLDVVVSHLNSGVGLYRNDAAGGRVQVRLKGLAPNTAGTGARLRLSGGPVIQTQEVISGGRYLSGDQAVRTFALGKTPGPLRLEVEWRSGRRSILTNVLGNRVYEILETQESPVLDKPAEKLPSPYFTDASALIGHRHVDTAISDPSRQSLLPDRMDHLGPGVAWYDFNDDGWEDLIVTAGSGGKFAILSNGAGQKFTLLEDPNPSVANQSAGLGWSDGKGNQDFLLATSIPSRAGVGAKSELVLYSPTVAPRHLPAGNSTIGPLAVADVDGDGDLDLLVGGRSVPGRYPEPASSAIWLNEQGELHPSARWSAMLQSVGMVSGATMADLDGDGTPDLVLALDWGPLRVFRNRGGQLEDMTERWGFAAHTGLWSGVAVGDFDGDGRLDLAAGNWGRNSAYELYRPGRPGLIYGEFAPERGLGIIEACRVGDDWLPLVERKRLVEAIPDLPERFPTHALYGRATVSDLLGARFARAKVLEISGLESAIFINRGVRFEWAPLPREAQLAPVFSVQVGDLDGDGAEDLFLSQNFFGTSNDLSRDDGGAGLWLRGDGLGRFAAVDSRTSGIRVSGEGRGAALADFNHDGRVDLAVSQNNAATKLYRNSRAKRGLRVTLEGAVGNPSSIGAQLRVFYANGKRGPVRSVQAGSGYCSQDSAIQILGMAGAAQALWIRWPGGAEQIVPVERQSWDLRVSQKPDPRTSR